jgi:hypothetical protein
MALKPFTATAKKHLKNKKAYQHSVNNYATPYKILNKIAFSALHE